MQAEDHPVAPTTTLPDTAALRTYFASGATRGYRFRLEQLEKLKAALLANEQAINEALYADLKKSPEEVWATELGLLLAEIKHTIRSLQKWMRPKRAGVNLVNLPSSAKIYRDPLGVVFIIAPWNYPLQLALVPLLGAIAGGNCAVIKPSELAPATAELIGKIIAETFPPAYIACVQGDGATCVPALMKSFRFDHVFYTGSIPVGKSIYELAAGQLVPVTLELGGKSPAIVEADADIALAARRIVLGKFINAGQTCIAPDYVLVEQSKEKELLEQMVSCVHAFYGSDPAGSYDYGKVINTKRFDALLAYLKDGTVVIGGEHNRDTQYIAPTILKDLAPDSPIMRDEIFGPLLPVIRFSNREEAMALVQQHEHPLAFYLFTKSAVVEEKWINAIQFGGGCINNTDWHFTNPHLPFGGVGKSGFGAYHGKHTFDTFTRAKPVMKTPGWFDPGIKYPSYKGKLWLFKKLFR